MVGACHHRESGALGLLECYDSSAENFNHLLIARGVDASLPLLQIALPLGISFLVFRMPTYVIDMCSCVPVTGYI